MAEPLTIPVFTLYGETEAFPDLVHCEPVSARSADLNWTIKPHRHANMAQVLTISDGALHARIDGVEKHLPPGGFLYIPPQAVHAFEFQAGTVGQVFSFPVVVLRSLGPATQEISDTLSATLTGPIGPDLAGVANSLAACLATATGRFRAQSALGLAHAMLALVAECGQSTSPDHTVPARGRLDRLKELIILHMGDGWTASDYASALAISTGHLSRICRNASGLGAQAYVERIVMDEACRDLAFTQVPVAQIGYRLGYGDPSYFSKRFRAVCGKSPTAYRGQFARRIP